MDGIHDMGGMHGFGPIEAEENEPTFHAAWEGRVLAICFGTPVPVPGGFRNNIENLDPAFYLASSYYEKVATRPNQGADRRRRDREG